MAMSGTRNTLRSASRQSRWATPSSSMHRISQGKVAPQRRVETKSGMPRDPLRATAEVRRLLPANASALGASTRQSPTVHAAMGSISRMLAVHADQVLHDAAILARAVAAATPSALAASGTRVSHVVGVLGGDLRCRAGARAAPHRVETSVGPAAAMRHRWAHAATRNTSGGSGASIARVGKVTVNAINATTT